MPIGVKIMKRPQAEMNDQQRQADRRHHDSEAYLDLEHQQVVQRGVDFGQGNRKDHEVAAEGILRPIGGQVLNAATALELIRLHRMVFATVG